MNLHSDIMTDMPVVRTIEAQPNQFGGIIVEANSLSLDPDEFRNQIKNAVEGWRAEGVKVVWLRLDREQINLVPVSVEEGFDFHHTEDDAIQLTLRLKDGAFIPPFATHYIGAGGVVLRDDKTLLVVAERYRFRGRRHYKLPGGALHPGEHITDAVSREVLEETGIKTRFVTLNCFRHWHGYRYGKSDIYFVCRLEPLTFAITHQEEEIEECLWMPVNEYLEHPDVHIFNRSVVNAVLTGQGITPIHIEGYGTSETHEFFMPDR